MVKWSNTAVCKTAIRGFDSHSSLIIKRLPSGSLLIIVLPSQGVELVGSETRATAEAGTSEGAPDDMPGAYRTPTLDKRARCSAS